MPPTQRRAQAGLIDQLIKQPCRFHFFQAVRLIELWLRRDAASHGMKLETVLRCKNSVALSFPSSQIEALAIDADTPDFPTTPCGPIAATMGRLRHVRLTPAFMVFWA